MFCDVNLLVYTSCETMKNVGNTLEKTPHRHYDVYEV
jgi:hypothetical protein